MTKYPKKAYVYMNSGEILTCLEEQAKSLYEFFITDRKTLDKSTIFTVYGSKDKAFVVNLNYMEHIIFVF